MSAEGRGGWSFLSPTRLHLLPLPVINSSCDQQKWIFASPQEVRNVCANGHRRPPAGGDTSPPGGNTIRHQEPGVVLSAVSGTSSAVGDVESPARSVRPYGRSMSWRTEPVF
jgi:hypothetical protein